MSQVWRNVLPGAFATLFRVSLNSCRIRASGTLSSSKLGARSISTVALLLRVSIGIGQSTSTENVAGVSNSNTEAMALAASRLLSAAFIAGGTNPDSDESKADVSSTSAKSSPESSFIDEVNARIPAPLKVLINIGSVHSSGEIKNATLFLVRVLLVDTRTCWLHQKKDSLFTVALECCLSLLNDDDGELCDLYIYIYIYILGV